MFKAVKKLSRSHQLFGLILVVLTAGCTFQDRRSVHVYQPPEPQSDREHVYYPLDPDNSNWIVRTCEDGRFSYSPKHLEFTPYGVVFKVIQCLPPDQVSDPDEPRAPDSVYFRYTGDPDFLPQDFQAQLEAGYGDED